MNKDENLTLDQAMELLQEKIAQLEAGETSLEESFVLYKEGMALLHTCEEKIDLVDKKVRMIDEEGGDVGEL